MNMNDMKRLQAAELHESAGEEDPAIVETHEWYGTVLRCDGFYLCVGRHNDAWSLTWQTRNRNMICGKDIDTCQRLLRRAQKIMQGGV